MIKKPFVIGWEGEEGVTSSNVKRIGVEQRNNGIRNPGNQE
jgi:hypothetical protein